MSWSALFGGLVGGGLGTLVWIALAYSTGQMHSYAAVGVGLLTGGGAVCVAWTSRVTGLLCALIASVLIYAGDTLVSLSLADRIDAAPEAVENEPKGRDEAKLIFAFFGVVLAYSVGSAARSKRTDSKTRKYP